MRSRYSSDYLPDGTPTGKLQLGFDQGWTVVPGVYAGTIIPLEGQERFREWLAFRRPRSLRHSEEALRGLCEAGISDVGLGSILGIDNPDRAERRELRRIRDAGAA